MRSCRQNRYDWAKRRLDETALIEFVEVLGVWAVREAHHSGVNPWVLDRVTDKWMMI
jgi:hypothetical protein